MRDEERPAGAEPTESADEATDAPKGALARAAETVAETVVDVAAQAGAAAGRFFDGSRASRLRKLNRTPIPNLYDLHPEASSASRRNLGLMTIPVGEIRGTAVEGAPQRGADFTPLPRLKGSNWRQRWQRLRAAHQRLAILPPIDVLQTEDGYWVLDGHNRVALALLNGQDDIDAVVTHVHLPGTVDTDLATGSLQTVLADSLELRAAARGGPRRGSQRRDEAAETDPPADA